ncbi:MAG: hypothetical protein C5B59_19220 [Bacteroidetes bacterium]|nr:MAG: hypothetical protein C5B59_19220 [Bacteroidota bacterium]
MKKLLFVAIVFSVVSFSVKAQCDKKITWTGAKADIVDASGNVERSLNEKIVFQLSAHDIKIVHGDREDDPLSGEVTKAACNWTEKYRNGKTVLNARFTETSGDSMDGSVTVEGKDGHIIITLQMEGRNGTKIIRVPIDNYKEL